MGEHSVKEKYGNLFDMYERNHRGKFTSGSALHHGGGFGWITTMSNIPGLFVLGEALFGSWGQPPWSECLDAGLADGYFVIPYTIGHYFFSPQNRPSTSDDAFGQAEADAQSEIDRLLSIKGKRSIRSMH